MNTQLDQLLKEATYFTPSKTVTLAADAETTIKFSGHNSNRYGVNRFLAGGSGLDEIVATASFNQGNDDKFVNIHLGCLNTLFENRSLRGAFEIGANTDMYLTLKNTGAAEHTANVQLIGYDDKHLEKKEQQYEGRDIPFPKPEFVFLPNTQIPAGADSVRYSINLPAYKLRLYRLAFGTNDNADNLSISIRQGSTRIKPEVFISQANSEFKNMDIILPQTLQAHTPFDLFVSNADGANPYQLSMLAECYKLQD